MNRHRPNRLFAKPGQLVLTLIPLVVLTLLPSAGAETLTVTAVDGQNGALLEGAFVMVGLQTGSPFVGNYAWTDANGGVVFDDPALVGPQTVTVARDGYGHTTLYDGAQGSITLPLFPPTVDATMGGTITHVEGEVQNIATSSNDGNLDIGLILPALDPTGFILGDEIGFSFGSELVDFPVIGAVEMPENSYMPAQVEYYFFTFEKTPWRLDVAGDRPTTFVSVAGRISIDALLGGATIDDFQIREVGVERDVMVSGPMNLNINSDLDLSTSLTAQFTGVPAGSDLLVVPGALIPTGEGERIVSFALREGNVDLTQTFLLPSRNPGGDMADALNVVVGAYGDSSSANGFGAGIMERDGFTVPHTELIDSWMNLPGLIQDERTLLWNDPTQPGVSPSPTWTRSTIGLRPVDPNNTGVAVTKDWRIYARADLYELTLPSLPPSAPGPLGGLPDPESTPDVDMLYWKFMAANSVDDPQVVVDAFLTGGTHWTMRWIPLELPVAGSPENDSFAGRRVRLQVWPNPSRDAVRLSWEGAIAADPSLGSDAIGAVELLSVDGRVIARHPVTLAHGGFEWNGLVGRASPPSGLYWARLSRGGQVLDQRPVLRVR